MTRRGVTLLEMLAALALLSLTIGAASSWLIGATGSQRRMREQVHDRLWFDRAADLLRKDLTQAWAGSLEIRPQRGIIRAIVPMSESELVEFAAAESNTATSGWARVEWSFDPLTGTLNRGATPLDPDARAITTKPNVRAVLYGVEQWSVRMIEAGEPDADPPNNSGQTFEITMMTEDRSKSLRWRTRI